MGFTEILTILFIALKLFEVIDWSWWLVLLPEIIAVVGYVAFFIVTLVSIHKTDREIGRMSKRFNKF